LKLYYLPCVHMENAINIAIFKLLDLAASQFYSIGLSLVSPTLSDMDESITPQYRMHKCILPAETFGIGIDIGVPSAP